MRCAGPRSSATAASSIEARTARLTSRALTESTPEPTRPKSDAALREKADRGFGREGTSRRGPTRLGDHAIRGRLSCAARVRSRRRAECLPSLSMTAKTAKAPMAAKSAMVATVCTLSGGYRLHRMTKRSHRIELSGRGAGSPGRGWS